jgi:hypothetical protein
LGARAISTAVIMPEGVVAIVTVGCPPKIGPVEMGVSG